jgi:hypothetical protein
LILNHPLTNRRGVDGSRQYMESVCQCVKTNIERRDILIGLNNRNACAQAGKRFKVSPNVVITSAEWPSLRCCRRIIQSLRLVVKTIKLAVNLSRPFRINRFGRVSLLPNTLCLTWGANSFSSTFRSPFVNASLRLQLPNWPICQQFRLSPFQVDSGLNSQSRT